MIRSSRAIPTVGELMTAVPLTIAVHESLVAARKLMDECDVRHLPVTSDGKLLGVLSDRDLRVAEASSARPDRVPVEDIMVAKPYTASPSTPANEVARKMAARKQGSAIVMEGRRILGVFTTTDALRALADALEGRTPRGQIAEREARRRTRPKTRRPAREAMA